MSYQTTVEELPTYTKQQIDDIRRRCTKLLQTKTKQRESVEVQDWLLEGVIAESRKRGFYIPSQFHVRGHRSFAGYLTKSQQVRELLLEAAPGLTPIQTRYLGEVAAGE